MASLKLAQILRISQHLTYQFNDVNHRISKAWLELELARGNLKSLLMIYDEWLAEEGFDEKEKQ